MDIQRATELFICSKLSTAIPSHQFLPFGGGSLGSDSSEIEPPFTVVYITKAERPLEQESTWFCTGTVHVISHRVESTSNSHSNLVRSIYAALVEIAPEANITLVSDVDMTGFTFHGIDVSGQRSSIDDESQAHANIFDFTCGVGG